MSRKPYKILFVDDDAAAHTTLALVLSGLNFQDRQLQVLNATSGAEGEKILGKHEDIAVVITDLGMEFDRAGLRMIERVRSKEKYDASQFIVITGNSRAAPPLEVVEKYDICDYIEKGDLTRSRLFVSLRTALKVHDLSLANSNPTEVD